MVNSKDRCSNYILKKYKERVVNILKSYQAGYRAKTRGCFKILLNIL